jgi:prepilin peptidase CpaA
MPVQQGLIYASAALGCATVATVSDARERKIPNWFTGAALLFGLLLHLFEDGPHGLGAAALAALFAGGIFFVFYIAGGMGAGDVKLMASLGGLSATGDVRNLLIATMIAGALLALGLAAWRGALRRTLRNMAVLLAHHSQHGIAAHPELNVSNDKTLRLPYAVPMAVASALVFVSHVGWRR